MAISPATQRYSRVAMLLHWVIALLIALQLALGWTMTEDGLRFFNAWQLHKSIGILILVLTLARVAQRLVAPRPMPAEQGWQGRLAAFAHAGLYGFMLLAPFTGWLVVSTAPVRVPTRLFGVLPLPHLPVPASAHPSVEAAHQLLAWVGVALILAHVAGALRHQLLLRDGLLWRMVPSRSPALFGIIALLLAGAVIAGTRLPETMAVTPARAIGASTPGVAGPATEEIGTTPPEAPDTEPGLAAAPEPATTLPEPVPEAAAATAAPPAAPPAWRIQPGGALGFAVVAGGGTMTGEFGQWGGTIRMNPEDPAGASIAIDIELESLTMGDEAQRETTLSDGFLSVQRQPRASFRADDVRALGKNAFQARGTLSLNGASRPQSIDFTLAGSGASRKVSGTARIAREDYGVGLKDIGLPIDPVVKVSFSFEAVRGDRD
ncbi:cytochrome b/b6 domain-containing protein [Polymorphobacter sp.]|uniref:cytochrome b/b6 domain-containing protein n=1 Tax=Polymorphobacter sp. TaxID=1909290 RepID=UPI003F7154E4